MKQDLQYCDVADCIFKTLHRCSWCTAKNEISCNSLNLISPFLCYIFMSGSYLSQDLLIPHLSFESYYISARVTFGMINFKLFSTEPSKIWPHQQLPSLCMPLYSTLQYWKKTLNPWKWPAISCLQVFCSKYTLCLEFYPHHESAWQVPFKTGSATCFMALPTKNLQFSVNAHHHL